jgi:hypothetical protein
MRQRGVFGHPVTHGDVRKGQVPILFVPSEANLPKSFLACLNHPLCKAISVATLALARDQDKGVVSVRAYK